MSTDVAFFMPSLAGGGAERVTLDLGRRMADRGTRVTLILAQRSGPLEVEETDTFRVVDLQCSRVILSPWKLRRALRRERPSVVVGLLPHTSVILWLVRLTLLRRPRLVMVHHNTMTTQIAASSSRRDKLLPFLVGRAFKGADALVAVSGGVADDLAEMAGVERDRIQVVYNPIDYPRILERSAEPVPDLVIPPGDGTLFVAAGRLVEAKAFDVLLDAFALADPSHRLVIMGEGPRRTGLLAQAELLGVSDRVALPGFVANPYAVFAASDVFVLSSRWEGLPTVLLEVLCLPLGIVSTDCRSGPREILHEGALGDLVPVGDPAALAQALDRAVRRPAVLDERYREPYAPDTVCAEFERILGVAGSGTGGVR